MAKRETPYTNMLVTVAPDSTANEAVEPPLLKNGKATEARAIWEILLREPYKWLWSELILKVRQDAGKTSVARIIKDATDGLLSSQLPKKYGWGINHDEEGRVALVAVDSDEYKKLESDPKVKKIHAFRNKAKE